MAGTHPALGSGDGTAGNEDALVSQAPLLRPAQHVHRSVSSPESGADGHREAGLRGAHIYYFQ